RSAVTRPACAVTRPGPRGGGRRRTPAGGARGGAFRCGRRDRLTTLDGSGNGPGTRVRSMGNGRKVAVIGAGFYGSTTAQRLAEYNIFDTVVLTDIIEGKPEGLALDMNQSRPIEGFET